MKDHKLIAKSRVVRDDDDDDDDDAATRNGDGHLIFRGLPLLLLLVFLLQLSNMLPQPF